MLYDDAYFERVSLRYPTITKGYSLYGAHMGRGEYGVFDPDDETLRIRVFHLPLDNGGYDPGGAYWGLGQRLYCAIDIHGTYRRFVRANSRQSAILALEIEPQNLIKKR